MLEVRFRTESAAFGDDVNNEVARVLRVIADKIERDEYTGLYQTAYDINGNDVGRWKFVDDGRDD